MGELAQGSAAMPSVSVVVPTKNERHNLPGLLASIPPDAEVVLCDASDDDTLAVARSVRPTGLTIVPAGGCIAAARHLGAEAASGELLVFTDADVEIDATYWARLREVAGDWDGVCGPKLSRSGWAAYYRLVGGSQRWAHSRFKVAFASGSNMAVWRERYFQLGGFRPRLTCNEDTELFLRAGRLGYSVGFEPELIVWATDHRRLERGALRKSVHSLVRNALIYATCRRARLPRLLRDDWSYWSRTATSRRSMADHDDQRSRMQRNDR